MRSVYKMVVYLSLAVGICVVCNSAQAGNVVYKRTGDIIFRKNDTPTGGMIYRTFEAVPKELIWHNGSVTHKCTIVDYDNLHITIKDEFDAGRVPNYNIVRSGWTMPPDIIRPEDVISQKVSIQLVGSSGPWGHANSGIGGDATGAQPYGANGWIASAALPKNPRNGLQISAENTTFHGNQMAVDSQLKQSYIAFEQLGSCGAMVKILHLYAAVNEVGAGPATSGSSTNTIVKPPTVGTRPQGGGAPTGMTSPTGVGAGGYVPPPVGTSTGRNSPSSTDRDPVERVILKITSDGAVYSGPRSSSSFSVGRTTHISRIWTYHWNDGRGATPGTITLRNLGSGQIVGSFYASGRDGVGFDTGGKWLSSPNGNSGRYWTVDTNLDVPAGQYEVLDSDIGTWSTNQETQNRGIVWIYGW